MLPELAGGSVDLVVLDSPCLSLDNQLASGTTRRQDCPWSFETRDIDAEMWHQLYRVMKPDGRLSTFLPTDSTSTLTPDRDHIDGALPAGLTYRRRWVCDKDRIGMGYNGRAQHEELRFLPKGKRRMPFDRSISDVRTHRSSPPSSRLHVVEKPFQLYTDFIVLSTERGDPVLDPMAGSFNSVDASGRRPARRTPRGGHRTRSLEVPLRTLPPHDSGGCHVSDLRARYTLRGCRDCDRRRVTKMRNCTTWASETRTRCRDSMRIVRERVIWKSGQPQHIEESPGPQ